MVFLKKIKIKPEVKTPEKEITNSEEKKWFQSEGKLTVDVYETSSNIVIQTAIAGVKLEDFDISIENDMLEIRGVRKNPEEASLRPGQTRTTRNAKKRQITRVRFAPTSETCYSVDL